MSFRSFKARLPSLERLRLWGILAVLVVLVVLAGKGVWGVYGKEQEARNNKLEARAELEELEARMAALEKNIAELATDEGVEAEIRDRFGVAKAGERAVVILSEEGEDSARLAKQVAEPSFLERWFGWAVFWK